MDLTPRQRADIVHVVLAAAEALGLKVSAINSTWGGEHLNVHLDREDATPEQGRALLDSIGLFRLLKGSDNPGDERCRPYSTVEGIASIAGVDVEVCIFTDFADPEAAPEPEPEPHAAPEPQPDRAQPELVVAGHPVVLNLPDPIVTCPEALDRCCPCCGRWIRTDPEPAEATR